MSRCRSNWKKVRDEDEHEHEPHPPPPMGQSRSAPYSRNPHPLPLSSASLRLCSSKSTPLVRLTDAEGSEDYADPSEAVAAVPDPMRDFTSDLPDECLAVIFYSLGFGDRKACSLVCRRWLSIEAQSRQRLSLDARAALLEAASALFRRFDAVTKLALRCDRRSESIGDEALGIISLRCPQLTRLKLRACRDVTDVGMAVLGRNCKNLRKLSCGSCSSGVKGIAAVLVACPLLEELSIKRLRGFADSVDPVALPMKSSSLRTICLKDIYNGQCFGSLITGSPGLRTLKLFSCSGDWDRLFEEIPLKLTGLVEVHLEKLRISDRGLCGLSACRGLEVLHLVKTVECTDFGLASVADHCRLLKKVHIDGRRANRIGDEGLSAVARYCTNLQELVLIGVNPTSVSIGLIAGSCKNLERLAFCTSETIGDAEVSCIASKCVALKKLCIKGCPVSDKGMEALAWGCPNLVKVKVKKCRAVTTEGVECLRASRGTLVVNLDNGPQVLVEQLDGSASDGGLPENDAELFPVLADPILAADLSSSSNGRSALSRARLGLLSGRNFMVSTLRKWYRSSNNHQHP